MKKQKLVIDITLKEILEDIEKMGDNARGYEGGYCAMVKRIADYIKLVDEGKIKLKK